MPRNVLIVDPNEHDSRNLATIVSAIGAAPRIASDDCAAIDALEHFAADIVIVKLPGACHHPPAFAHILRTPVPEALLVALTALDNPVADLAGFDISLGSPFRPEDYELIRALSRQR
jgi:DNA-binding response OmpR family regulator